MEIRHRVQGGAREDSHPDSLTNGCVHFGQRRMRASDICVGLAPGISVSDTLIGGGHHAQLLRRDGYCSPTSTRVRVCMAGSGATVGTHLFGGLDLFASLRDVIRSLTLSARHPLAVLHLDGKLSFAAEGFRKFSKLASLPQRKRRSSGFSITAAQGQNGHLSRPSMSAPSMLFSARIFSSSCRKRGQQHLRRDD